MAFAIVNTVFPGILHKIVLRVMFVRDKHPEKAGGGEAVMQAQAGKKKKIRPKLLNAFLNDVNKAIDAFRDFQNNGDMDIFVVTAHSMKSALLNVHEPEMSAAAFMLENAGCENNVDEINKNLGTFIKDLENLARDLSQNLDKG